MKTRIILFLIGIITIVPSVAQHGNQQEAMKKRYAQMLEQEREEAKTYYAGADTAQYGIRYLWTYLYDKEQKRSYKENRIVLVAPSVTLDMSYQSIGEKKSMENNLKTGTNTRDSSLVYRLTPSFYFYYPAEKRLKRTYRIISDEFLLKDTVVNNTWTFTDEEKMIGGYHCKKAYCVSRGRKWQAWYTSDLPYVAAPRQLVGLPGVVLEASDENEEIKWQFEGYVSCDAENRFYLKFPDKFSDIPVEKFPLILNLFALSGSNYIEGAKVLDKSTKALPEKLKPSTGIDACRITNFIELE